MQAKRRSPRSVSSILDDPPRSLRSLLARAGEVQAVHDAVLALLPDELLPHVRAVHAEGDALVIVTASPAWATRLRFIAPGLLEHLAARTDLRVPPRVKVMVRTPPTELPAALPPRARAPSRHAAEALLQGAASFAPDDPLRRALERLSRRAR